MILMMMLTPYLRRVMSALKLAGVMKENLGNALTKNYTNQGEADEILGLPLCKQEVVATKAKKQVRIHIVLRHIRDRLTP
jgi:hypothetical protein